MKKHVTIGILLFVNVIAGTLVTYGLLPNQANYILIPPFLLLFICPIKWDRNYTIAVIFICYLLFNAFSNHLGAISAIKFSKYVLFGLILYFLTEIELDKRSCKNLLRLLYLVGIIQLPVVILQILLYPFLLKYAVTHIIPLDITTGTFWLRNDPALNFYLIGLISFLMFTNLPISSMKRYTLIGIYTLTVFLSNSQLLMLYLIVVYGIFILIKLDTKQLGRLSLFLIPTLVVIHFALGDFIYVKFLSTYNRLTNVSEGAFESFFAGSYSRTAAILYFLTEPLKVIGDGVGAYVDLDTNEYRLGLKGQLFIFYAEIGLIGLILSIIMIVSFIKSLSVRFSYFQWIIFGLILVTCYTTRPLTDISILLTFMLLLRLNKFFQLNQRLHLGVYRH